MRNNSTHQAFLVPIDIGSIMLQYNQDTPLLGYDSLDLLVVYGKGCKLGNSWEWTKTRKTIALYLGTLLQQGARCTPTHTIYQSGTTKQIYWICMHSGLHSKGPLQYIKRNPSLLSLNKGKRSTKYTEQWCSKYAKTKNNLKHKPVINLLKTKVALMGITKFHFNFKMKTRSVHACTDL